MSDTIQISIEELKEVVSISVNGTTEDVTVNVTESDNSINLSVAEFMTVSGSSNQITDSEIEALGYIKTDTNTQLSQSDIEAMGFSTFDNVLSDADITALGYIKTDTNTQLSDLEVEIIIATNSAGFVTTDNDTQLSDADITALGYIKTDTNTQLNDSDITALGYVKTDNNTQLSDADITALGYVKTDTNTQLTDSEILALGYIKTDNNTQLTDAEISALGYIKTDNNTQLTDAEIAALGYVKSGTTMSFFQVQDDGTTMQDTTGTYEVVAGMWATPTLTNSDYTFNSSNGELTVNTAGIIEFDCKLVTYQNGNNRHELYIELQKNGTQLTFDSQYASRNNTNRIGGAYIMGFKDSCIIGDVYRIRTKDVGVNALIGHLQISGTSYISAKLYS